MCGVVGMAKLGADFDASCIITHAYQPCLLHSSPIKFHAPVPEGSMSGVGVEALHSRGRAVTDTQTHTLKPKHRTPDLPPSLGDRGSTSICSIPMVFARV